MVAGIGAARRELDRTSGIGSVAATFSGAGATRGGSAVSTCEGNGAEPSSVHFRLQAASQK
jgi:hypothetical protein